MLPASLYERISAVNRAWDRRANEIADPGERAMKYRAIYSAYTSLVELALRVEALVDPHEQIVAVVELENRLRAYERTAAAPSGAVPEPPAALRRAS